jgi:hypothetical protein
VDGYNWQEIKVQKDAYDQQVALERTAFDQGEGAVSGQTISSVSMESPDTFVDRQMRERDPVGYQVGGVIHESLPALAEMLGGWS